MDFIACNLYLNKGDCKDINKTQRHEFFKKKSSKPISIASSYLITEVK